jgi:hypothetical protein
MAMGNEFFYQRMEKQTSKEPVYDERLYGEQKTRSVAQD